MERDAASAAGVTPLPVRAPAMLPDADLDHVVGGVRAWERLRGARILVTGATGFVGKWLLASLLEADRRLDLGVSIVALSRDPAAFLRAAPAFGQTDAVEWVTGDVRDFALPRGRFGFVVHGATEVIGQGPPLELFDTIVTGTRRVLDCAVAAGAHDVLLLSSGAVYGRQPPELARVAEDFAGAPDLRGPGSAYGEGKRVADWLGALYAAQGGLGVKSARIYAQVGPHLPLDQQFAIGNFIGDALQGRPVRVRGDGSTIRSYLYAADLAVWLWTILLEGRAGAAYNVGSDEPVALGALARRVAALLGSRHGVEISGAPVPPDAIDRYVPDTRLARAELGLHARVGLDEAILRTARWHGWEA